MKARQIQQWVDAWRIQFWQAFCEELYIGSDRLQSGSLHAEFTMRHCTVGLRRATSETYVSRAVCPGDTQQVYQIFPIPTQFCDHMADHHLLQTIDHKIQERFLRPSPQRIAIREEKQWKSRTRNGLFVRHHIACRSCIRRLRKFNIDICIYICHHNCPDCSVFEELIIHIYICYPPPCTYHFCQTLHRNTCIIIL